MYVLLSVHATSFLFAGLVSYADEIVDKGTTKGDNGKITSIITATAAGGTATGTFELDTFTEYSKLRQKITVSTTATGGSETVAAVVLAGGVAWFLAGKLPLA